jgi:hypothetical protein
MPVVGMVHLTNRWRNIHTGPKDDFRRCHLLWVRGAIKPESAVTVTALHGSSANVASDFQNMCARLSAWRTRADG